jgi:predicted nucleic acid-binding Zn ribbon protein
MNKLQFFDSVPETLTDHPAWPSAAQSAPNHLIKTWPANARHCPGCGAIIYCRRHELCGVCGATLPHGVLFKESDAARVEQVLAAERARHRRWMARISENR